jgi:arsenate reductase
MVPGMPVPVFWKTWKVPGKLRPNFLTFPITYKMIIYHNPSCSKSRQSLALLSENGMKPEVIEYLKTPLDEVALRGVIAKLGLKAHEVIRTKEEPYQQLALSPDSSEEELIAAIVKYPILMERPIVVKGDSAVIGRPPENVHALF